MKVIDLLNKIAKGEEVPEYIRYRDISKHEYNIMMACKENIIYQIDQCILDLNDEVEIIEEDKDIEKLKIEQDGSTYYIKNEHGTKCYLTKHSYLIADKVNELIDEVKKLKGKYE